MSYLPAVSVRLMLGIAGVVGAFFAPPWVPLFIMFALALRYPAWEVLGLGLLVDLLWFTPSNAEEFMALPLFTLVGLALVWGFDPLRREFLEERGRLL